jgi:cysteine-rich repeat protein
MRQGALAILLVGLAVACGDPAPLTTGVCGDGVVDLGEACDRGALNGTEGVGCTATCTPACVDPATDCEAAPACQVAVCTTDHVCVYGADASQDGTSCGTDQVCSNGGCVSEGECGNGIREGTEACDFGEHGGPDSGCNDDCTFSCTTSTACDDGNPCNGEEICGVVTVNGNDGQKCVLGTPPDAGTACGTDMVCISETCVAGTCGDGFVTGAEECDDANATPGDGCENNCMYSCVSTDATRDCSPADPCAGPSTCDDTTHTCSPRTPLADNTLCGSGGYCKAGVCTQPVCPNGVVEPGETCDDGNMTNGDGCDNDCTYSCVNPATDCGTPPPCQMYTCSAAHTCQAVADTTQNGNTCGTSGETCNNGACTGGECGNGIPEMGEQCDFGPGNGPGTGCEADCTFSCTILPDSCDDNDPCNGVEVCTMVTVNGKDGQKCTSGTPLADNTSCGTGKICKSQACVTSICGDGYIDTSIGESCEPPNTTTCDAQCRVMICGDGIRAGNEQCDDGNLVNLDGCDASCKFEQSHRTTELKMQWGTTTYCPANRIGYAIAHSDARKLLQDSVDLGILEGTITVIFHMLGLDDLSGTSDPQLDVGVLGGLPVAGTGYDGTSDLDWWHTISTDDIDSTRTPTTLVPGSLTAKVLNAGPSNLAITVNFVGTDVTMDMFNTKFRAPIGSATTPLSSSGGPPGHLASENLDPALQSFATMGTSNSTGEMCGATRSRSLANIQVPSALIEYCSNYTVAHSMLDVFIGGCRVLIITIIRQAQPDVSTDGATYAFQANAQRYVTACTRNGQAWNLEDCLDKSGYTTYYRFLTNRVIPK